MTKPISIVTTTYDRTGIEGKPVKRVASDAIHALIISKEISVRAYLEVDKTGFIQVSRNGIVLHRFEFDDTTQNNPGI